MAVASAGPLCKTPPPSREITTPALYHPTKLTVVTYSQSTHASILMAAFRLNVGQPVHPWSSSCTWSGKETLGMCTAEQLGWMLSPSNKLKSFKELAAVWRVALTSICPKHCESPTFPTAPLPPFPRLLSSLPNSLPLLHVTPKIYLQGSGAKK